MGAAYFIVLERKIDGLDTMLDGKMLSKSAEVFDALATRLGVKPITEFLSVDPAQMAEFMAGEGNDVAEVEFPPLQQFSAKEGLKTISALLSQPEAQLAIQDLKDFERILTVAAQREVGWHLEADF